MSMLPTLHPDKVVAVNRALRRRRRKRQPTVQQGGMVERLAQKLAEERQRQTGV